MTTDTKKLRDLANAATPGEWLARNRQTHLGVSNEEVADWIVETVADREPIAQPYSPNKVANAAFIAAANPQTVIALLDEIDRLREQATTFETQRHSTAVALINAETERDIARSRLDSACEALNLAASNLGEPAKSAYRETAAALRKVGA